jgi:hypothetical protein
MFITFNLSDRYLKIRFLLLFSLCVITVFLSCSSKESGEVGDQKAVTESGGISGLPSQAVSPQPGTFSLTIVPVNATRKTTIYANPSGFDLAHAKVDWLVNNLVEGNTDARQFKAEKAYKGARIQARAVINGQEILSNVIQIGNSPPVVNNAVFTPEPGDKLSVDATATDLDEDEMTISYEWTRNGEPAGNTRQINVPLQDGDKVQIKITPFDGEMYGKQVILYKQVVKSSD